MERKLKILFVVLITCGIALGDMFVSRRAEFLATPMLVDNHQELFLTIADFTDEYERVLDRIEKRFKCGLQVGKTEALLVHLESWNVGATVNQKAASFVLNRYYYHHPVFDGLGFEEKAWLLQFSEESLHKAADAKRAHRLAQDLGMLLSRGQKLRGHLEDLLLE